MQVNSINSVGFIKKSVLDNRQQSNESIQHSYVSQDKFVKTNKLKSYELAFRGKPKWLSVPYTSEISADEAWGLYSELALGNYLDIEHSTWDNKPQKSYSDIRQHNLSFLDKITNTKEKKEFIKRYKKLTGFPDLEKVSKNIEDEFCKSVDKMGDRIDVALSPIVRAGYNPTCSVGKGTAFPGSDLDGAYIILRGSGDISHDDRLVERAKGYLWNATDQRILSYNHNSAFPQIYTLTQIEAMMKFINAATNKMNLHGDKTFVSSILTRLGNPTLMDKYRAPIQIYTTDYCAANEFFIELSKYFRDKKYSDSYSDFECPTKEILKNFGFFLDVFRNGTHFEKYDKNYSGRYRSYKDDILDSDVSKLTNVLQIRALKRANSTKPKIQKRKNLSKEFKIWDTDKQYEFVKTLIQASCGENERDMFPEYFANGPDYFEPLLRALGKKG